MQSTLTPIGHQHENVDGRPERFLVLRDDSDGTYWTYDPDFGNGLLCRCSLDGKWSDTEAR